MSIAGCDRIMAFARVIGPIFGDATYLLIRRVLIEEIGQHGRVTNAAAGYFNCSYLKRFLVDPPLNECTIRLPGKG
jgi:hypothetical protein